MQERYQELQERYSVVLLDLLRCEPEKFIDHARRNAGSNNPWNWPMVGKSKTKTTIMKASIAVQD
ncbi:hypothetical protein E1B28_009141 [Marasmius oreades]|uniref:Uncharacterized protein n=1 Tax=Marasmius oreades TaxID=181124 RepID=A0A9P7S136_9AGAR|nr:uncharacterized protein E1B28_009141 [Marasmius oreades]KAG7092826.1 hypothetical protein E1B28_009141 [Marasmius oreades]